MTFRNSSSIALTSLRTTTVLHIPLCVTLFCRIAIFCFASVQYRRIDGQSNLVVVCLSHSTGFVDFERLHASSCSLSLFGLNGPFRKKKTKQAITVEQWLPVKTTWAEKGQNWVMDRSIVTMKVSITLRDSHVGEGFTIFPSDGGRPFGLCMVIAGVTPSSHG